MNRRQFVTAAAGTALASAAPRTGMGIATTCYMTAWRPKDTLQFLEHCRLLGAGGIQASLSSLEPAYVKRVRDKAEAAGMYVELMGGLPKGDPAQFEATLKAGKEVGALCVRSACLGGRRYETFRTREDWNNFVAESKAAIERGVRIAERLKVRWALENHKDWTAEEFVAILKQYPSEYLGVCVDTGNNISLLDDPMEVVEALAPRAFSTHLKDMGVRPYEDGFLLSEVPMGEGLLDLKGMVEVLRRHHPKLKLTLEMITRNPLKVPCLTDQYWVPFERRNGRYLARTLRLVAKHSQADLPTIEGKNADEALSYENANVKRCLDYASSRLGI
ncbi:MAG: sugar phosphate isomerase/epimerase [Bryobacterales bacterium]|nr:sugar phosphate isomerase/epimerase [Bryobacterales bacterium]